MSTITQQNIIYSDFQAGFTIHPVKKDLSLLTNENSVKRSIINILKTNNYERRFRPRFGGNIAKYLFENATPATLQIIKNEIISAIQNYEPRAVVLDVVVSTTTDANSLAVSIVFSLINNSKPTTITLSIPLNRLR
jgi:phage baseplate assembly protein W